MLVELMTKKYQKNGHQFETSLLKALEIQHPSNHSLKMSQNTIV